MGPCASGGVPYAPRFQAGLGGSPILVVDLPSSSLGSPTSARVLDGPGVTGVESSSDRSGLESSSGQAGASMYIPPGVMGLTRVLSPLLNWLDRLYQYLLFLLLSSKSGDSGPKYRPVEVELVVVKTDRPDKMAISQ